MFQQAAQPFIAAHLSDRPRVAFHGRFLVAVRYRHVPQRDFRADAVAED